jgi:predicted ATP-dependent Lon-type protease
MKIFKNNCHTDSRYECYDEMTVELNKEIKYWKAKTENAHLYYKSVPCSYVLRSSLIGVSLYALFVSLSILI